MWEEVKHLASLELEEEPVNYNKCSTLAMYGMILKI